MPLASFPWLLLHFFPSTNGTHEWHLSASLPVHPDLQDRIIDRESATIFIIMEFCENGDLASVIRKYKRSGKKMEEHKIWSILFQLTCALHECHNRKDKILHRDIKVPLALLIISLDH